MRRRIAFGFALGLAAPAARGDELLVRGFLSGTFSRYDAASGAFVANLDADLRGANGLVRGPSGDLFAAHARNDVFRYDGETGAFVGPFVGDDPSTPDDESHGLDHVTGLAFGPDGNLYASGYVSNSVIRYDGRTGAFLDVFVAPRSGGLNGADIGLAFGPDGSLYVASQLGDSILRYDGTDGHFVDAFVPALRGGLRRPTGFVFAADGYLYVSSSATDRVLRFDAATGAFVGGFVAAGSGGLRTPTGLVFGPDGDLYVSSAGTNSVLRYDGATGAFLDVFVAPGAGGLAYPTALLFVSGFHLRMDAVFPAQAGFENFAHVEGATTGGSVAFFVGTSPGSTPLGGCASLSIDLVGARLVGTAPVGGLGTATLGHVVPARFRGRSVDAQAIEVATCRASRVVTTVFR
jgi:hypothetical protein